MAAEIVRRLPDQFEELGPSRSAIGWRAHAWEQFVLPMQARAGVLWSPCNTGPVCAKRHVITIHDMAVLDHPEWFSRQFWLAYKLIWHRLALTAAHITTVSQFSKIRMMDVLSLDEDRITVVYPGVGAPFGPARTVEIERVRRNFDFGSSPYFVSLSTLEPRKNITLTIEAWRRSRLAHTGARLVMIGNQGSTNVFRASAHNMKLPGVVFTGRIPDQDVVALLSGAVALVYPSRYEGFGLPVLEAMACGTQVVTTRCGSLPEVGGECAIYVDADDPDDLTNILLKLVEHGEPQTDSVNAALARAAHFTWDKTAGSISEILAGN